MKVPVGAFNQEKALVGAFSVIVQLHRLIDLRHYLEHVWHVCWLAVRMRTAHLVWLSACGPGSVTRDTLVRGMVTCDTGGACEVFTASSRFCTACNSHNLKIKRGVSC